MKHYFVCSNSGKGFVNYFDDLLKPLNKIYILKAGPGTGKSTLMKNISKELELLNYTIDYVHCSSDPDSLDGIIINELSCAIVDGTAPHIIEPNLPGVNGTYVNLSDAWDTIKLEQSKNTLQHLQSEIQESYKQAYKYLKKAKSAHDKLEKYYIAATDFSKIDEHSSNLLNTIKKIDVKKI